MQYSHSEEVETIWQKIKAAFTNAGEEVLGFHPHRKKQWMSEETWLQIEKRREAKIDRDTLTTRTQKSERARLYNDYIKQVRVSCKRDKRLWYEHQAQRAESAAEIKDLKLLNEITRKIAGEKPRPNRPIKDKLGYLLSSNEDQLERFKEHFSEILKNIDFFARH